MQISNRDKCSDDAFRDRFSSSVHIGGSSGAASAGAMSSSSFMPVTAPSNRAAAGASLKLPFVVAVLASCSYIIAADQKSREVQFQL